MIMEKVVEFVFTNKEEKKPKWKKFLIESGFVGKDIILKYGFAFDMSNRLIMRGKGSRTWKARYDIYDVYQKERTVDWEPLVITKKKRLKIGKAYKREYRCEVRRFDDIKDINVSKSKEFSSEYVIRGGDYNNWAGSGSTKYVYYYVNILWNDEISWTKTFTCRAYILETEKSEMDAWINFLKKLQTKNIAQAPFFDFS